MKKLMLPVVFLSFCFAPLTVTPLFAQPIEGSVHIEAGVHEEPAMHPRIVAAIHSLEDAIDYMQNAPHDFGGHKKAAIQKCRSAIKELKRALAYREHHDNR